MELAQILKVIDDMALFYRIDKPYMIGGVPRDSYIGGDFKTTDIDMTTNSSDSLRLGLIIADKLDAPFKIYDDGHITVFYGVYELDFSSNFISEDVLSYIDEKDKNIAEAFSRDFTINTIHQDLGTRDLVDPTNMAFEDVKNKLIRTPVPAKITLSDDPRRAFRAVELAVRYDFDIDGDIISFVNENLEVFSSEEVKDRYVSSKINKAMEKNPKKTIALLKELGLFRNVPLTGKFKEYIIDNKILVEYLGND